MKQQPSNYHNERRTNDTINGQDGQINQIQ